VLTEGGRSDVAATVATQTTYPSWGNWFVNGGATTPFEFWELDSRSRGHMFLGTIVDWFYADLAGLRTEAIGASGEIEIKPHPIDGLEHASAWTETPRGRAASAWRRTGEEVIELDVTVPVGVTAEVHVPASDPGHVSEGGVPAADAQGVSFVRATDEAAVYEVASGSYGFVSDADYEPAPGGAPRLDASVKPKKKVVGPNKKKVRFRFRVANRGGGDTGRLRLCARAPKRKAKIIGKRCQAVQNLAAGRAVVRAFKVKPKPAMRGKKARIRFIANGPGVDRAQATARLRVRR
jgi:hypothetical protein